MKKTLSLLVILLNTFLFSSEVISLPNCVGSNSETFNNCFGTHTLQNGLYEGEFKNGKFHGQGKIYWPDNNKYEGEFKHNKYDGQGTYTYEAGTTYIGEYKNGKKHGIGIQTYLNGGLYEGEWQNGEHNGIGTETFPDGRIYSGEFQDGKAFGFGTLTLRDRDGTGVFKGEFINGKPLEGTLYNNDVALWRGTLDENFNGWGYWTYGGNLGIGVGQLKNGEFVSGVKTVDGRAQYYVPNNATETQRTPFVVDGKKEWIGFECNSGYQKIGMFFCREIIQNGYWSDDGLVVNCNAGYEKNTLRSCRVKSTNNDIEIPPNAYASGSGWKCNDGYYRDYQNCRKLPPNGVARYDGEDFSDGKGLDCESGYEKNKFKRCGEISEDETKKPKKSVDDNKVYSAASGSGFAVTSDGYVITNYHVIEGCTDVYIHDKGESILSTTVTFDPNNDIALLKGDFKPRSFYPLSRKNPQLLMDIYAAGFPFGQDMSTSVKVTQGIISSLTGVANNFSNLQISAALQPGNSGGPIMNDKGNVIGVAVAKLDLEKIVDDYGVVPENVNFGVKSNLVINILESENIKLPSPNTDIIPKSELVELITDGTYYLSCWMTLAQIEKMQETKVMFKDLK